MSKPIQAVDQFGVPEWIGEIAIGHQKLLLSDTQSYRLLMVIFRSIIEMGLTSKEIKGGQIIEDFLMWFIQLGSSSTVWPGLMFLHQGVGQGILSKDVSKLSPGDERFARIITAYIVLTDERGGDPSAERYFKMLQKGWHKCHDEEFKGALYRGFIATLLTQSKSELVGLGAKHGLSESGTNEALRAAEAHFAAQGK